MTSSSSGRHRGQAASPTGAEPARRRAWEALRLESDRVGTGHVLLAALEAEDGTGVLAGLGLDKAAVAAQVSAEQGI